MLCMCFIARTTENFFWLIPYDNEEVQEMFDFIENEFALARENGEKVFANVMLIHTKEHYSGLVYHTVLVAKLR